MAKRVPMATIDAAWLGMEDPTNLMMVTGVMALDGPVDLKRLRQMLDRRLKPFGRFHQLVVRPRSRGNIPHWEEDERFEIENHLSHVALPEPGDDAALRQLVSELMSVPLDFGKPLWHMHVIDGYRGGSVILARIHHSIADGIALVRVLLSLTDESPNGKPQRAAAKRPRSGFSLPLNWLITNPSRALEVAYRLGRMVMLPSDPQTLFKGELGRRKRAAWSEPVPLVDFKAIGNAYGATVNDVLVATATAPCAATWRSEATARPGSRFARRCRSTYVRSIKATSWAMRSAWSFSRFRSGSPIRLGGCERSRRRWTSSRARPRRSSRSAC